MLAGGDFPIETEDVAIGMNEGLAKARDRGSEVFPPKLQEAAHKGAK